jgi:hypothetical protein
MSSFGSTNTGGSRLAPFWDEVEQYLSENDIYGGENLESSCQGKLYAEDAWDLCKLDGISIPGKSTVAVSRKERFDIQKKGGKDGATLVRKGLEVADITITVTLWLPLQWRVFQEQIMGQFLRTPNKLSAAVAAVDAQVTADTQAAVNAQASVDALEIRADAITAAGGDTKAMTQTLNTAKRNAAKAANTQTHQTLVETAVTIDYPALQPYRITNVVIESIEGPVIDFAKGEGVMTIKAKEYQMDSAISVVARTVGGGHGKRQREAKGLQKGAQDASQKKAMNEYTSHRPSETDAGPTTKTPPAHGPY